MLRSRNLCDVLTFRDGNNALPGLSPVRLVATGGFVGILGRYPSHHGQESQPRHAPGDGGPIGRPWLGLRYRVAARPLREIRRTADLVFTRQRVAVFVDGCYWHACPEHFVMPSTNSEYWQEKIARNKTRDADTDHTLAESGWTVVRVWEHEPAATAALQIADIVHRLTFAYASSSSFGSSTSGSAISAGVAAEAASSRLMSSKS
jgi:DNA mismatch endonuclease, patch repair protein